MEKETPEQAAFREAWGAIMEIALQEKVVPMNKLTHAWNRKVGKWEFWLNGTNFPIKEGEFGCPVDLPRFVMYVTFNGWPAGFLDPYTGTIVGGEAASIFTFRDALRAELLSGTRVPEDLAAQGASPGVKPGNGGAGTSRAHQEPATAQVAHGED